jgi:hypothetical protein
MSMQWLMANAPGFGHLSEEERNAIIDFSLLWSLFEARILDHAANAANILATVARWHEKGTLSEESYDAQLSYFQERYFADGTFTYHFGNLHLRRSDHVPLVRSVIDDTSHDSVARVATVFIIILRYRNNLFHGIKWTYELADQLGNFTNANVALMTALEQHGQLQA